MKTNTAEVINIENTELLAQVLGIYKKFKAPVSVYLINGIRLNGVVTDFDERVIILTNDGNPQVVYKNAISTVSPNIKIDQSAFIGNNFCSDTIEDIMITEMIEAQDQVNVFLVNGIRLNGVIVNLCDDIILLSGVTTQIVFKNAISTILNADGGYNG